MVFEINDSGKMSVLRGINFLYTSIIYSTVNRKGLRQNTILNSRIYVLEGHFLGEFS